MSSETINTQQELSDAEGEKERGEKEEGRKRRESENETAKDKGQEREIIIIIN